MADQFYFGNDMQDMLLACMLTYRSEFHVLGSLVQPEFMWGVNAMRVTQAMQDYHEQEGIFPGFVTVDAWLLEKFSRDKADIYKDTHDYLEDLKKLDTSEWKWIKSFTLKFCKERALIVAIKKAADLVKTDKVPEGGFTKMFDEAMSIGRDMSEVGISFIADAKEIILKATDRTWGIKTGYTLLDDIWRNGWGPGWLITILAPPKSYKSTFCVNLALSIAKKATNIEMCPIFYFACEISAELTALRGYSIVSNTTLDAMHDAPAKFINKVNRGLGEWFGTDNGKYGQILLKSYAAKTATIADIRAHAMMAIETLGMRPRVIIIDHAETVKVSKSNEKASDHRAQADIYTEARALGQELGAVIIMPDRCNKETVQQTVPNMTSFQGSFEKAGVVDVAIGLCQTDTERIKNVIRYFVFMNRHGKQFDYFTGKVGADHFSMTIDIPTNYELALEEAEAAAKERRKGLRGEKGKLAYRRPNDLNDTER